jgi:hypothetical protein
MTTKTKTSRTASSRSQSDPNQAALDDWAGRVYTATLPSGTTVSFRLPSLGEMAALGDLPAELHDLAVAEWAQPGIGAELAAQPFLELRAAAGEPTDEQMAAAEERSADVARRIARLNREMISRALVKPTATPEQLERMPYRDLEMLSALINRGAGNDAAGRYVGVVPLDQFQVVAHAHGAECDGAQTCASCFEAGRELAAVQ